MLIQNGYNNVKNSKLIKLNNIKYMLLKIYDYFKHMLCMRNDVYRIQILIAKIYVKQNKLGVEINSN